MKKASGSWLLWRYYWQVIILNQHFFPLLALHSSLTHRGAGGNPLGGCFLFNPSPYSKHDDSPFTLVGSFWHPPARLTGLSNWGNQKWKRRCEGRMARSGSRGRIRTEGSRIGGDYWHGDSRSYKYDGRRCWLVCMLGSCYTRDDPLLVKNGFLLREGQPDSDDHHHEFGRAAQDTFCWDEVGRRSGDGVYRLVLNSGGLFWLEAGRACSLACVDFGLSLGCLFRFFRMLSRALCSRRGHWTGHFIRIANFPLGIASTIPPGPPQACEGMEFSCGRCAHRFGRMPYNTSVLGFHGFERMELSCGRCFHGLGRLPFHTPVYNIRFFKQICPGTCEGRYIHTNTNIYIYIPTP